ncbi:MAG: aminopeptidase [Planctomycetota bacterium]|nr:aminopeptidase [Planctomycetota bacterium]
MSTENTMNITECLERYAELIVRKGCNVQPGQTLYLGADAQSSDFAVKVAEAAYEVGARFVQVDLVDDRFQRARIKESQEQFLDHVPRHVPIRMDEAVEEQGAMVRLVGAGDPKVLSGLDADRSNRCRLAHHRAVQRFYDEGIGRSAVQWCVASAATIGWAESIFDNLKGEPARDELWRQLFKIVRADRQDCLLAWDQHSADLNRRSTALNALNLDRIVFSGPGTGLTVGLSERARFEGGAARSQRGNDFIPNLPTEEVFTTPDWRKTEGEVRVTRPFLVNGTLVQDLTMKFSEGVLVDFTANAGEQTLRSYVDSDEGARRLGEVALVGIDSPVFQSGHVFGEILLDENAACHIAVGNAYKTCLEDGVNLSKEQLEDIGYNSSTAHTDMMISNEEVDVIGVSRDGSEVDLLRGGAWVLEG